MNPPLANDDVQMLSDSESGQANEEREAASQACDEALQLPSPSSCSSSSSFLNSMNTMARRPVLLSRSDSIGTESESSSSRANSPLLDRKFKRVSTIALTLTKHF